MAKVVDDYINEHRSAKWEWGVFDCSTVVANWVDRLVGEDPIADIRGAYKNEDEYLSLVEARGSLLTMYGVRAPRMGFLACHESNLKAGDIGVVVSPLFRSSMPIHCGAIYTGKRWAVFTRNGFLAWSFKMVAAWSCPVELK